MGMKRHTSSKTELWLECLQSSGCRLTGPRCTIVEILTTSERALNAREIYDLALKRDPSIGLVSVYRTLAKLEQLKLIQRVHEQENCQAYLASFDGHQHLIVCQRCGVVEFFTGDNLDALVLRVEKESGYRVVDHWLQLFGLCQSCKVELAK